MPSENGGLQWRLSDRIFTEKACLRELSRHAGSCPVPSAAGPNILRVLPSEQQSVNEKGVDIAVTGKGCYHKLAALVALMKYLLVYAF